MGDRVESDYLGDKEYDERIIWRWTSGIVPWE